MHWPDAPTTTGDSHRVRLGSAVGGWWYGGIRLHDDRVEGRSIASRSHPVQRLSMLEVADDLDEAG